MIYWRELKCKISIQLKKTKENEMSQAKDVEPVVLKFLLKGRGHHPSSLWGTGQIFLNCLRLPGTVGLNIFKGNLEVKRQRSPTMTKSMKAKVFR